MRLYLSDKEAILVRVALITSTISMTPNQVDTAQRIVDRMDLCDKLQNSEHKSKSE